MKKEEKEEKNDSAQKLKEEGETKEKGENDERQDKEETAEKEEKYEKQSHISSISACEILFAMRYTTCTLEIIKCSLRANCTKKIRMYRTRNVECKKARATMGKFRFHEITN